MSSTPYDLKAVLAFVLVATVTAMVYWPGLAGPFVLDDHGSLSALGELGGVRDWETLKAFVLGGFTGPTGRPLTLLTFLIDGSSWPTDPWPFKRTNLLLHIVNGGLLAVLATQIFRLANFEDDSKWLGLLCAAAWLLHPFLVSTTLYPVQRMAQLAATFVFSGMSLYIYARKLLAIEPAKAYVAMSIVVGGFTILAVMSKENGVLLPLLIGVLEFTLIRPLAPRLGSPNRLWVAVFVVLPTLAVLGALAKYGLSGNFFEPNPPRDYSTYERLLTQARVVFDYLGHWFVPKLYTTGVFQDHFSVSTGVVTPITTALSITFHVGLLGVAFYARRRLPLLAFSVLFYYCGHLLESTILNLELYFEHRNYLPAAFLYLAPAALLYRLAGRRSAIVVGTVATIVLAAFTNYSARVWQSYEGIVQASALAAPGSARAQQQYSMILFNQGNHEGAFDVIEDAIDRLPQRENLWLWRSTMLCQVGRLDSREFSAMAAVVASKPYDLRSLANYELLVSQIVNDSCPEVDAAELRGFLGTLLERPINADPAQPMFAQISYLIGFVEMKMGNGEAALMWFRQSLDSRPGAGRAMRMAANLASDEYYPEAQELVLLAQEYKRREAAGEIRQTTIRREDIDDFLRNLQPYLNAPSEAPRR